MLRLEGRISLYVVTCPISTDRFMFIGGPAIISPFIILTEIQKHRATHGAASMPDIVLKSRKNPKL